ncbi:hypothetical protein IWQ61_008980 [Dispira simplex]|nr:hypothetical protein IWQ61_008980 [Dispira simplex]
MAMTSLDYEPLEHTVVRKRPSKKRIIVLMSLTALLTFTICTFVYFLQLKNIRHDLSAEAKRMTLITTPLMGVAPSLHHMTRLGFDRVFSINLDSRPDRLQSMIELADMLHIDFQRVRAVTAEEASDENGPSNHRACWKSHTLVYKEIANNPHLQNGLILEDDIDMELDIQNLAHQALETLNSYDSNWDMFYIGHCAGTAESLEEHVINKDANFYRSNNPVCTHGYAVSKRGAQKLLKLLEEFADPLDLMLINAVQEKKVNSYSLGRAIIIQYHFDGDHSDINMDGQTSTTGDAVDLSARERLAIMKKMRV